MSCQQTVGCGQLETSSLLVYTPLILLYFLYLLYNIKVFVEILHYPVNRTFRTILLFVALMLYIFCKCELTLVSQAYFFGIFIQYSDQLYASLQLAAACIFIATLLISISAIFKLAWELKYFYEPVSPSGVIMVTDLFLLLIYVALFAYFFGALLQAKFKLAELKLNHMIAALFFLVVSGVFVYVKIYVYISLKRRFINLYRYFRKRILCSFVLISVALFSHFLYDLVMYMDYKLDESDTKYTDFGVFLICELMPLVASSHSMRQSISKETEINASIFSAGSLLTKSLQQYPVSYRNEHQRTKLLEGGEKESECVRIKDTHEETDFLNSENNKSTRSEVVSSNKADNGSMK